MVKKMKLPFLFMKSTETTTTTLTPSWPWPTCGTPKTPSFRAAGKTHVFNTINDDDDIIMSPLDLELEEGEKDSISIEKVVVRGLRSERLFFEPAASDTFTSSILDLHDDDDDGDGDGGLVGRFKESVVMAVMDSTDPFVDFRRSMQEMVESHDHKDWEFLEELLTCYLRVNGKSNHGYIVGAFVDLLVGLALSSSSPSSSEYDDQYYCSSSSSSCCITTNSFTSPLSFSSSSTFSTTNLEVDQENNIASSSSSN